MLIATLDNKIVGVDKKLLHALNIDLAELSSLISSLKLELSSLKGSSISLKGKEFSVMKIEMLSNLNLNVYILKPAPASATTQSNGTIPEDIIKIEDDSDFEIPNDFPKFNYDDIYDDFQTDNAGESQTAPLEMEEEPTYLTISFDEDEESEILNYNYPKLKAYLEKELQKSAEELEIGVEEILKEFEEFLKLIRQEKKHIYKALEDMDYDALEKFYEKIKSKAIDIRLSKFITLFNHILKAVNSKEDISVISTLTNGLYNLIENKAVHDAIEDLSIENEEIDKNLVFDTIQHYLTTQDEETFQEETEKIKKKSPLKKMFKKFF